MSGGASAFLPKTAASGLPADLPGSSYAVLSRGAAAFPDRIALTFFLDVATHRRTEDLTYRRLLQDVTRTANLFHAMGMGPDDVVAVMLPNLIETHLAIWGGEAAGIVMPVNPMLGPDTIASLLTAAGARVLVTLAPFPGSDVYDKAVEVVRRTQSVRHVALVGLAPHVPGLRGLGAVIGAAIASRRAAPMPPHVEVTAFSSALRRMRDDGLDSHRAVRSTDVASYFCTGGTTGLPRIAVRTHGQEVANAWMTGRMLSDVLDESATVFCGLPLFHVNAVIATGLTPFMRGGRVVLGTPLGFRSPGLVSAFREIVSHHRVAGFSGVPTLLNAMLDQPDDHHDLSALRFAFSGAAPLSAELLRRFEDRWRIPVVEGYGLTEAACVVSMNPVAGERRAGSVGLPLPAQEVRTVVLDHDRRFVREAAVDEIGVVTVAGPNVFSGYLGIDGTQGPWIDRGDGRQWLDTGDLGRFDRDGYLWLTGRTKDVIIRGGHNIDPSMIEEALQTHPDVALAAAIGRPDRHAGEVPVAYVQLHAGAEADEAVLLSHAALSIGERAAIPKSVIVVDALPLTAIGKIHKPTLRHGEVAGVVQRVLEDAGVRVVTLAVEADAARGSVVRIETDGDRQAEVRDLLSPFAFAHECRTASGSDGQRGDVDQVLNANGDRLQDRR